MRIVAVASAFAFIMLVPLAAQSQGISDEAKQHFQAGVSLLQDPEGERVEDAYREFKKAYEISGSSKVLGNIGFCAMRLERDGEAIDAYSTYLRDVPDIEAEERAQITRDLQTLTVGVVRVTIEVDRPGVRLVDVRVPVRGDRITNVYGPVNGKMDIGIRPGHHLVTAKLDGFEDTTWELDAYAGSREKHAFLMQTKVVAPPPPRTANDGETQPRRSPSVLPWIIAGTGGAMMIAGTITGVVALGKTSDIEDSCPGNTCPKSFDLEGQRSTARTFVRLTDILLIGGGILLAGGVTWGLLSSGGSEQKSGMACTVGGCGGRF
jgi:hypothetical protein